MLTVLHCIIRVLLGFRECFRKSHGSILKAYTRSINVTKTDMAELWAVMDGLRVVAPFVFFRLVVETNSVMVVN